MRGLDEPGMYLVACSRQYPVRRRSFRLPLASPFPSTRLASGLPVSSDRQPSNGKRVPRIGRVGKLGICGKAVAFRIAASAIARSTWNISCQANNPQLTNLYTSLHRPQIHKTSEFSRGAFVTHFKSVSYHESLRLSVRGPFWHRRKYASQVTAAKRLTRSDIDWIWDSPEQ